MSNLSQPTPAPVSAMTLSDIEGLKERLRKCIERQRRERGDYLNYGAADPELAEALAAIEALQSRQAKLVEALERHDAADAECPARKRSLGDKDCPKCGANSSQGCGIADRAAYTFIEEVRQALTDHMEAGKQ